MRGYLDIVADVYPGVLEARIDRVFGTTAESRGLTAPLGATCAIESRSGHRVEAEVIGCRKNHAILAPIGELRGVAAGDRVVYRGTSGVVRVGMDLLGCAVDASGRSLDSRGHESRGALVPIEPCEIEPRRALSAERSFVTGVRAIDGLFPVGRGHRVAVVAAPGLGTTTLFRSIANGAVADAIVLAFIGGSRQDAIELFAAELAPGVRARSVAVIAADDEPPLARSRAALTATAIAEFFRAAGKNVLLLVDSLSASVDAHATLGAAGGERRDPRGIPPSSFPWIARLLGRCGRAPSGSLTGIYAVAAPGNDSGAESVVTERVRALVDSELRLSRRLAERGHYPAIDLGSSFVRGAERVRSAEVDAAARGLRSRWLREDAAREASVDAPRESPLDEFLRQAPSAPEPYEATIAQLTQCGAAFRRNDRLEQSE